MTEVGRGEPIAAAPPPLHGCTVCFRDDLARARVLGRSFVARHPGATFTVLVADGARHDDATGHDAGEAGMSFWSPRALITGSRPLDSVLPLGDAGLARRSARPWLASTLLDLGRSPLVIVDPWTLILRSLWPLAQAASRSGAAFVPRLIDPSVAHHNQHATAEVLAAGVIDPGLAALVDGVGSRALLTWWKSLDPRVDGGRRAFDLAPGFGHAVVRDPGIGLSRWNLHERRVLRSPSGPTAGGAPLRTISFDGLLARHGSRWSDDRSAPTPAYELGEPLYELASDYLSQVASAAGTA
jgi:hypothetical protein